MDGGRKKKLMEEAEIGGDVWGDRAGDGRRREEKKLETRESEESSLEAFGELARKKLGEGEGAV